MAKDQLEQQVAELSARVDQLGDLLERLTKLVDVGEVTAARRAELREGARMRKRRQRDRAADAAERDARAKALLTDCATCGATAGQPCKTASGRVKQRPHQSRPVKAQREMK